MARKIQLEIVGDSRSIERAFGRAHKAGGKFGSAMKTIGKVAGAGIGAGFLAAGLALRAGFAELAESQKAMAQTSAVLRSTGGVANVTAKHVDRLATSLSRMSGIDDEAIIGGENMLLTFTNIRNSVGKNNKIFDAATRIILDMSVAMGKDLPATAIMVGKALNDTTVNAKGTITGWSALRRVGVMVTPEMMKMAAAFIEAGKPMEAQKLLLRELQTEFGGSARAFGTTMPGALGKLRNAFDEIAAAFATGFLPIILKVANTLTKKLADPAFVARVSALGTLVGTKLYNAFVSISSWFEAHWPQIQRGFQITGKIIGGLVYVIENVKFAIVGMLRALLTGISGVLEVMSHLPLVGGKFTGALESVNAAREGLAAQTPEGQARARRTRRDQRRARQIWGGHPGHPRQFGGPVMPGAVYRVHRDETVMFGSPGNVIPAGGGGISIGVVNLHGVQNPRQFLRELQRLANTNAASRRGVYGGANLALG